MLKTGIKSGTVDAAPTGNRLSKFFICKKMIPL